MPWLSRDDTLMIIKATMATVIAWVVADRVMGSATPYYAPLAALLVVDKTIVRSLGASVRRIFAVGLGMGLAWLVGTTLGLTWWSMGIVILGALVIGRWRRLGDHGIQVPSMALLSLLTAGGTSEDFTALTMLETLVGGVIGVVVNIVVLAPLHVEGPRQRVLDYTRRVRGLLDEVAEGLTGDWGKDALDGWRDTADRLHVEAEEVVDLIELGRESQKLNPRDQIHKLAPAWDGYGETVEGLRRATWHVSGLVRTLRDNLDDPDRASPSQNFLAGIASVLREVSTAFDDFGVDADGALESVGSRLDGAVAQLDELTTLLHETPLDDPRAWPVHGALLHDCQRLVAELRTRAGGAVIPPTD
ncbi:aromatic acid exporter family protein [Knoellia sp. S7-12]|uniref:FUSC family protein n=1 Tax=Knoellia sp. S7-12 TaxID=3126698 RepID=UPI0033680B01